MTLVIRLAPLASEQLLIAYHVMQIVTTMLSLIPVLYAIVLVQHVLPQAMVTANPVSAMPIMSTQEPVHLALLLVPLARVELLMIVYLAWITHAFMLQLLTLANRATPAAQHAQVWVPQIAFHVFPTISIQQPIRLVPSAIPPVPLATVHYKPTVLRAHQQPIC